MTDYFAIKEGLASRLAAEGLGYVALVNGRKACGTADPRWRRHIDAYLGWLRSGFHGSMAYLQKGAAVRADPTGVLPGLAASFVFLIPYAAAGGSAPKVQAASRGRSPLANLVARYARSKDYHGVIKRRLTKIFDDLSAGSFRYRVVVDSVPFLDRAHAQMARLGFVGRNTMLIRPGLGSYFFIASVLTDAPVERFGHTADAPAAARRLEDWGCATCNLCVRACPTGALLGDYTMDARRCLSYWSIEHRGTAPDHLLGAFQESFFGCDICQEVCPYNLRPRVSAGPWNEFVETSAALGQLTLRDVATMSPRDYETWFGGLPLTRAKYPGLVRNALYALFAMGEQETLREALAVWEQRLAGGAEGAAVAALREVVDQVQRLCGT